MHACVCKCVGVETGVWAGVGRAVVCCFQGCEGGVCSSLGTAHCVGFCCVGSRVAAVCCCPGVLLLASKVCAVVYPCSCDCPDCFYMPLLSSQSHANTSQCQLHAVWQQAEVAVHGACGFAAITDPCDCECLSRYCHAVQLIRDICVVFHSVNRPASWLATLFALLGTLVLLSSAVGVHVCVPKVASGLGACVCCMSAWRART